MMPLYYKLFYVSLDLSTVSHTSLLWRCHHTSRNWGDPSNYHRTLRVVFNWVSIVITQLLWFCIATVCDWLKNLAPLYQKYVIRSKMQKPIVTCLHAFPALGAGYMYFLRALIGLLDCSQLFWLVRVITLVLVLRHSIENRSGDKNRWARGGHGKFDVLGSKLLVVSEQNYNKNVQPVLMIQ